VTRKTKGARYTPPKARPCPTTNGDHVWTSRDLRTDKPICSKCGKGMPGRRQMRRTTPTYFAELYASDVENDLALQRPAGAYDCGCPKHGRTHDSCYTMTAVVAGRRETFTIDPRRMVGLPLPAGVALADLEHNIGAASTAMADQ
jgi:hypothetical protein